MASERIGNWMERVDGLSARERALVFVGALGVLWVAWSQLLFEPLLAERDRIAAEIERTRGQVRSIHEQIAGVAAQRAEDPDAGNQSRLAALRTELEGLETELQQVTKRLVPPRQMAGLLETMLTREPGLALVRLEGLGARPVFEPDGEGEASPTDPAGARGTALFRHGLRVVFEGGYMAALRYLRALEALPWQFLWESVALEVEDHPAARVSITVHSLSLEQAWIGV